MQDTFNPYRKWLAIPPEEQPPTLYRLLGVAPFEADPDVIDAAADARMGFLRTFRTGPNAAVAERLLNEVARARVCLADAKRRAAYDNPAPMACQCFTFRVDLCPKALNLQQSVGPNKHRRKRHAQVRYGFGLCRDRYRYDRRLREFG